MGGNAREAATKKSRGEANEHKGGADRRNAVFRKGGLGKRGVPNPGKNRKGRPSPNK